MDIAHLHDGQINHSSQLGMCLENITAGGLLLKAEVLLMNAAAHTPETEMEKARSSH